MAGHPLAFSKKLSTFNHPILLLFASTLIIILFLWEGHIGINLNDEAFVWYGSIAIGHGKVPIRDFYAYDPGRYYLTAFIMMLLGHNGIIVCRIAEALFQGIGLFLALSLLSRFFKSTQHLKFIYLSITAMTLVMWMVPLYKTFDITASIVLIAILTYLIEINTLKAYFWTGVVVGIVAIIGRNHGVYGAAANLIALVYLSWKSHGYSILSAMKWWLFGLLIGYMPMMLMILFIPGFSQAFFKSIYFIFANKSTNLFLPIPWPWNASTTKDFITGFFFLGLCTFGIFSLCDVFLRKLKNKKASPLLCACAFLAFPYAHYAFSRADNFHLALGIFPMLIGIFAYLLDRESPFNIISLFCFILLFMLSIVVIGPLHPGIQCLKDKNWQHITITNSILKIDPESKNTIEMFKRLIDQYAANGQSFLVAPFNIAMYPIFQRESPMWDLFPFFTRSLDEQREDILRINKANPRFIVIYHFALDENEDRRFCYTHPVIYKYIEKNFALISHTPGAQDVYIYKHEMT